MGFVKRFRRARRGYRARQPALLEVGDLSAECGGKGRGLRTLRDARLPVLATRTLSVDWFWAHLEHLGLADAARAGVDPRAIADALRSSSVPEAWRTRWVAAARALGPSIAVRSSSVDEDGAERSFAGVHASRIGVAPEQIVQAVLEVWASALSPEAVSYGVGGGMAVLLQPALDPLVAGVTFTIDPQSGSWRELIVEAVAGQGEALVSGRQAPQWFVLRRGARLRIVDEGLVPQPTRWISVEGDLVGVPNDTPAGRLLEPDAVRALARSCLRAEKAFGQPVDVEWAWDGVRFVLLQARPITALDAKHRIRDVLWTRRFLGERLPTAPHPLTFSVLAPVLEHFIGYPDVGRRLLGDGASVRLWHGHAYLNVTVFRHLLFKWPGAPAPSFMLELLPPEEADHFRRRYRVTPDLSVYAAILRTTLVERRWERFAWNPLDNPRVWSRFEAALPERLNAVTAEAPAMQRVDTAIQLLTDYLAIHVCSLLFANLSYQLLQRAVRAWVDGSPHEAMAALATSEAGNRTLELNRALVALGDALGEAGRTQLANGIVSAPTAAFLERYGARAEASWELFSPRWRDHPERLADLMATPSAPRPRAPDTRSLRMRRRWALGGLVRYTQRYLLLRENQRFAFDQITMVLRDALLGRGHELGLQAAQVPWCTVDELRSGAIEPTVLREREQAHAAAPHHPPAFLRGDEPAVPAPSTGDRLRGQGISSGRATGRVRVLHTLEDASFFEDGEILVAPALDPGWTPLLTRAGGLVIELGSLLSHGAVVAREYGVPGVANVHDATTRLVTGQLVTLDGTRGDVWITPDA